MTPGTREQLVRLYAIWSVSSMGYVPPTPPVRLNLDRHGMPKDYATYMWLLYGKAIEDNSPARRAFLNGGRGDAPMLPSADLSLIGETYR